MRFPFCPEMVNGIKEYMCEICPRLIIFFMFYKTKCENLRFVLEVYIHRVQDCQVMIVLLEQLVGSQVLIKPLLVDKTKIFPF